MTFLDEISAKVDAGTRLTFDEGVRLMKEHDVGALGQLANRVRQKRHGDRKRARQNRSTSRAMDIDGP